MNSQLCSAPDAQLVLVDIQEKLAAAMPEKVATRVARNGRILVEAAQRLAIPIRFTEQYPRGLGPTVPELRERLPDEPVEKTCFSCRENPAFRQALHPDRQQIVLCGMETHVCILQTAMELRQEGRPVFVVADAVCSRHKHHHKNALARMAQAGVVITNVESVLFEWLRDAAHPQFRELSRLIR